MEDNDDTVHLYDMYLMDEDTIKVVRAADQKSVIIRRGEEIFADMYEAIRNNPCSCCAHDVVN